MRRSISVKVRELMRAEVDVEPADEPECSQRWTVKTREELVYCATHARDYVVVRNKSGQAEAP